MNNEGIHKVADSEIELVTGGVIEGPDGKSCTDPRGNHPQPGLLQGGPEKVSIGLMTGQ